jgi:hypothetical protein
LIVTITPSQAQFQMQTQPQAFLEKYPVRIYGDPTGSHVTRFRIEDAGSSQRPGAILGTHSMHATQLFAIKPSGTAHGNPPGATWFDAHSVKMFDTATDLAAIGTYTLPVIGGPNVMVTGHLSGCSFAIHDNGDGSLVVAHIRPSPHIDALTLQSTLGKTAYWTVVYGRHDYPGQVASIVGSRIAGRWHVWGQKQDDLTRYSIRSVKKLI